VRSEVPLKDPVLYAFEKHEGAVTCVQCSPHHANTFISCGTDNEIRIYHLKQVCCSSHINAGKSYDPYKNEINELPTTSICVCMCIYIYIYIDTHTHTRVISSSYQVRQVPLMVRKM
jgi:WD40 repeat protein